MGLELLRVEPASPFDWPLVPAKWHSKIKVVALASYPEGVVGPCWEWHGWNNNHGRGQVSGVRGSHGKIRRPGEATGKKGSRGGPVDYIHRWSFEMHNGVVLLAGEVVDHLCRNRACWRPSHLDCCTQRENMFRSPDTIISRQAREADVSHLSEEDIEALARGW